MLDEKDIEYLSKIQGSSEPDKARNALKKFKEWLIERQNRIEPLATDFKEYEYYLTAKGTNVKRVNETMSRLCRRYGIIRPDKRHKSKKGEQQIMIESTENHSPADMAVDAEPEQTVNEPRTEKITLYLTPTKSAAFKALCNLDGVKIASRLNELIDAEIAKNADILKSYYDLQEKKKTR